MGERESWGAPTSRPRGCPSRVLFTCSCAQAGASRTVLPQVVQVARIPAAKAAWLLPASLLPRCCNPNPASCRPACLARAGIFRPQDPSLYKPVLQGLRRASLLCLVQRGGQEGALGAGPAQLPRVLQPRAGGYAPGSPMHGAHIAFQLPGTAPVFAQLPPTCARHLLSWLPSRNRFPLPR